MVQLDKVKIKIQEYILSQIDSLGATNPAIKLVKPLAKRAIVNNMDGIDKWLRKIADADGNIDIDGIVHDGRRCAVTAINVDEGTAVEIDRVA